MTSNNKDINRSFKAGELLIFYISEQLLKVSKSVPSCLQYHRLASFRDMGVVVALSPNMVKALSTDMEKYQCKAFFLLLHDICKALYTNLKTAKVMLGVCSAIIKRVFWSLKCKRLGPWGGTVAADLDAQAEVLQLGQQCSGETFWCWWEQLLCVRLSTQ